MLKLEDLLKIVGSKIDPVSPEMEGGGLGYHVEDRSLYDRGLFGFMRKGYVASAVAAVCIFLTSCSIPMSKVLNNYHPGNVSLIETYKEGQRVRKEDLRKREIQAGMAGAEAGSIFIIYKLFGSSSKGSSGSSSSSGGTGGTIGSGGADHEISPVIK